MPLNNRWHGGTSAGEHQLSGRFLFSVCSLFGVTYGDLKSRKRGMVTLARWALAYLHREHLGWSYERIGEIIGKEHSAMMYAYTQACILLHEDIEPFAEVVRMIEEENGY